MKKLRKGLFLLLFTSVIAIFCIAVAADGGAATPWQPEEGAGITFASFTDEAAYLSGEAPNKTFTANTITTKDTRELSGSYVIMYSNLTLTYAYSQVSDKGETTYPAGINYLLDSNKSITIDCNGFTISTSQTFYFYDGKVCTFELRNGTLNSSGQIQINRGATLVMDNMTLSVGTDFGYSSRGNLYVKNSTIKLSNSLYWSNNNKAGVNLRFENTTFIYQGKSYATSASAITGSTDYRKVLVYVILNSGTNMGNVDISFDKDCKIQVPNMTASPILLAIKEGNDFAGITKPTLTFTFEDGMSFTKNVLPTETYFYKAYGESAFSEAVNGTASAKANVTYTTVGEGNWYANKGSDGLYTLSKTPLDDDIAYYVFSKGTKIARGTPANYTDGVDEAIITIAEIKAIAEGSTIVFNKDVRTSGADSVIFREFNKFLTLDLNGHTLYADHRWGTSNKEGENFTLKNGKVIVGVNNYFLITYMGAAGGTVNIEDVEIEHNNSANAVFHLYGGTINLKNVKVTTTATAVVSFVEPAGACVMNVEGVTVNAASTFLNMKINKNTHHDFVIKDSVIKAGTLFNFQNTNADNLSTADNYLNLNISGCKFDADFPVSYPTGILAKLTLNLSETYSRTEIKVNHPHVLNFAEGEKPMAVENSTYSYAVTKPSAEMQMNLVLDSELKIKLYIPKDTNVVSVKLGETLYTVAELEETITLYGQGDYYVLPLIALAPNTAADFITLEVAFTKDGMKHTANLSLCLTDYLMALLETEYSGYLKRLVTATGEYIAAAYDKEGRVSEALDALRATAIYKASLGEAIAPAGGVSDMQALKEGVIEYARLNLDSTPKIRFGLKDTFSGVITISGYEYLVTNGIYAEESYIEINLAAYDLYDTVFTLEANGISGTYSLAAYAEAVLEEELDVNTEKLIRAFYNYCAYADAYESRANKS